MEGTSPDSAQTRFVLEDDYFPKDEETMIRHGGVRLPRETRDVRPVLVPLIFTLLVVASKVDASPVATDIFRTGVIPIPVELKPRAIVINDFNADGIADLAVANAGTTAVSVLFGTSAGRMTTDISVSVPFPPSALASGDINGDGLVDLVVGTEAASSISVLLNPGGGLYETRTDFPITSPAQALATGDLNSDGRDDVAAVGYDVAILLAEPISILSPPLALAGGGEHPGVTIDDLDGNGSLDVAVSNGYWDSSVYVYHGTSDGNFTGPDCYSIPGGGVAIEAIQVGAVNSTYLVVAVADQSQGTTSVVVISTTGDSVVDVLGLPQMQFVSAMCTGDLNRDGLQDLALVSDGSDAAGSLVAIALGDTSGGFSLGTVSPTGRAPSGVRMADLNGDGLEDLCVSAATSDQVWVHTGNGDGTIGRVQSLASGSYPLVVAISDVNGDGVPDLVTGSNGTNEVWVFRGLSGGGYVTSQFETSAFVTQLATGDVDGDGDVDLVACHYSSSFVTVLYNDGTGVFTYALDFTTGGPSWSLAIADFNRDGALDISTASRLPAAGEQSRVSILLNDGRGDFSDLSQYPLSHNYSETLGVTDLDGDGSIDLISGGLGGSPALSATLSILRGNGDGSFAAAVSVPAVGRPSNLRIGDLDGDGVEDIVQGSVDGNSIGVYFGVRETILPSSVIPIAVGKGPRGVAVEDVNGDGVADIVTANCWSHTISLLLGAGDGTFPAQFEYCVGNQPFGLAAGDLNEDGLSDIAVANAASFTIETLLNRLPPSHADRAPAVAGPANFAGGEGLLMQFTVSAGDPDGDAITALSAAGTAIAAGGTFAAGAGNTSGTFTWTPGFAASTGSPYDVTFTAANSLSGSLTTSITVEPCFVVMGFALNPATLNLRSMGHWVTAYLEPPSPFTPTDIDIPSVRLSGTVPVDVSGPIEVGDYDSDGLPELRVKFDRATVELTVGEGDSLPITVMGTVRGQCFHGTDYIRVLRAVVSAPSAGSVLTPGSTASMRWTTPPGVSIQSVAVLSSVDDGATWGLDARYLPDSGAFDWTVPGVTTSQARVAVVLVESSDDTGYMVDGVLGTSGRFSIRNVTGVDSEVARDLALRAAAPSPSYQTLHVTFSLPDVRPATITAYDVGGRLIETRDVAGFGPGVHTIMLGERERLPSGVYFVRLTQAGKSLTVRAILVR
jgi:hypothetical protein